MCPLCGQVIPLTESAVEAASMPGPWFHTKCTGEIFPLVVGAPKFREEVYAEWEKLNPDWDPRRDVDS